MPVAVGSSARGAQTLGNAAAHRLAEKVSPLPAARRLAEACNPPCAAGGRRQECGRSLRVTYPHVRTSLSHLVCSFRWTHF